MLIGVADAAFSCGTSTGEPVTRVEDLTRIGALPAKGRVQDPDIGARNPTVEYLLREPRAAVEFLISRLDSKTYTESPPICPVTYLRERVVALILLTDLFLSDTFSASSRELCWAAFLRQSMNVSQPDYVILDHEYGDEEWEGIKDFWTSFWAGQRDRAKWDTRRQFMFLRQSPLFECPVR